MSEEMDKIYMRRCLQIAANGRQNARPNPMVGAVIVCNGRIIGEGYHVRCGEGHAEVNAFASVRKADEHLLPQSTAGGYRSAAECRRHPSPAPLRSGTDPLSGVLFSYIPGCGNPVSAPTAGAL